MRPFLKQVAEYWYAAGDIRSRCFVFPNRRSLAFFRRYLAETVAGQGQAPLESPAMFTVNDFFYYTAGASAAGRVSLLLDLYACYKSVHPSPETLDEFIFWGDVLLSDFDDVDKYLIDPERLFTNVSELKDMRDTYSYLTDTQRAAVERFIGHFQRQGKSSQVKASFLQVWNILLPLYRSFRSALEAKGEAYEGQVYRSLAERMETESAADIFAGRFPDTSGFVFVGLNALNECERRVLRRMRDAGLASFCWDWSDGWISDPQNKSSVFMKDNIAEFPQAFTPDGTEGHRPRIDVLGVPSSVGQAMQLPSILSELAARCCGGDLSGLGIDTAVVLPDESLLMPVLNSIPPEIRDINVTMGYPMSESAFHSFLMEAAALQMHLRQRDGEWYFYHRQVHAIFSNGVFKAVLSDAGRETASRIKSASQYYIPRESFRGDPVIEAVFRPVILDPRKADGGAVRGFCEYLTEVILAVAPLMKDAPGMAVELDFARECYLAVNRLSDMDLPVLPATFVRLLSQILDPVAVPFTGEPLKGLQVMGPLETRALDFRNLIILSADEGTFPRKSSGTSFIPPELRKGFGLPTYEYQDAVWAYYFYRMVQRAENVWMVYDSRTEGLKAGEESRYIKQLEMHFDAGVVRHVAKAPIAVGKDPGPVVKTAEDIETIKGTVLSASSLQNYLYCPAKFYYHTVRRLKPEDEVAESLDAGMIGNVFHNTMCALYMGPFAMDPDFPMDRKSLEANSSRALRTVTREYIRSWMDRPGAIRARISSLIRAELNTFEVSGRNLVFADVVYQYVMKVLSRDLECMDVYGTDSFEVLGLELERAWEYDGFRFKGYIDRMDSFRPGEIRVVDYKTGKVTDKDINISDDNAKEVVDLLFGLSNANRPKIALQLFLYDMFVTEGSSPSGQSETPAAVANSVYSPAKLFVDPVQSVPASPVFASLMKERLSDMLREISDPAIPFYLTEERDTCSYCDFKTICGR